MRGGREAHVCCVATLAAVARRRLALFPAWNWSWTYIERGMSTRVQMAQGHGQGKKGHTPVRTRLPCWPQRKSSPSSGRLARYSVNGFCVAFAGRGGASAVAVCGAIENA
jgi:hypothetical protein